MYGSHAGMGCLTVYICLLSVFGFRVWVLEKNKSLSIIRKEEAVKKFNLNGSASKLSPLKTFFHSVGMIQNPFIANSEWPRWSKFSPVRARCWKAFRFLTSNGQTILPEFLQSAKIKILNFKNVKINKLFHSNL